ncbi:adenylate cyclase [Spirochaetia bacterium]|nr:adenylate cyclase [Spirochaetia bacterium]
MKKEPPLSGLVLFMLLSVLGQTAWGQNFGTGHQDPGNQGSLYINLRDYPIYIKTGFDPADIQSIPASAGEWTVIAASPSPEPVQVGALDLPGLPKRRFLSPFGAPEMEFTYLIPFTIENKEFAVLAGKNAPIPGIFLAGLGDNWEIYLNGSRVAQEMHRDEGGRITSHRVYQQIAFPLDKNLIKAGENVLAFRIVGDPTYMNVGFFYAGPYYIADYARISRQNDESLTIILIGVYLFMGLYHLFMFLIVRKDRHNLFYGLFSLIAGLYFLARTHSVYDLIPDRNILFRLELFCLFLVLPLGAAFAESLGLKKTFLITRIYGAFYGLLAFTQLFFSLPYAMDTLKVFLVTSIPVILIILVFDIAYILLVTVRDIRRTVQEPNLSLPWFWVRVFCNTSPGNITIGAVICVLTGLFDIFDSLFFHYDIDASRYGFFVFTAGASLILARRFGSLYSQQQRVIDRSQKVTNARLVNWIVVRDRDPEDLPSVNVDNAIMFTDIRNFTTISEKMSSGELTNFLTDFNEVLAKPLFAYQDLGYLAYTDKFVGDGTMNIFNDPAVALNTAVQLRTQLALFNENPRRYFKAAPEDMKINVGTGIAWGPVTMGVMGHSRRVDYTPIGDTVNIASRLEGLTKEYHASIIINDALYQKIEGSAEGSSFFLRHIDRIRVKGKDRSIDIYEEFSSNSPRVREMKLSMAGEFKELQEMYFSGKNWDDALVLAEDMSRQAAALIKRYHLGIGKPADHLPLIYAERMRIIMKKPELLENWDGVYTFLEK